MNSNDSGVDSSSNDASNDGAASSSLALKEFPIPKFKFTLPIDIDIELPVFAVPLDTSLIRPKRSLPLKIKSNLRRIYNQEIYPTISPERKRQKLCAAASNCDVEIVKKYLDLGADPNCSDEHMRTPLHLSACRGHFQVVQHLIISGANPNVVDSLGNTPLHLAVISASSIDYYFVVSFLLKSGANPHSFDRNGKRPQQLAESKLRLLQYRANTSELKNAKQEFDTLTRILRYFDTLKYDDNDIPELEQRLQSLTTEDRIKQSDADTLLANIKRLSITK